MEFHLEFFLLLHFIIFYADYQRLCAKYSEFFLMGTHNAHVNAGIGFTGPPVSLNAPPEVTLFTLS
jgi:predicted MPP superfamily phosphohydrolase